MSQQDHESGPESLLTLNLCGPWPQVDNAHPLARLHEKFWGKDMAEEEGQLSENQGILPFSDMNNESNIGPGCYILNVGMKGCPRLWVRSEYIRMYDFCNEIYNRPQSPDEMTPLVTIIGQPGIGKSYWVFYAICRCLSEQKPCFWYFQQKLFLFVGNGVFEVPEKFHENTWTLKPLTRTFVDADELGSVPPELIKKYSSFFVIFTTSPARERWSRLSKSTCAVQVIMNPWTEEEIFKAAAVRPDLESDDIRERYHKFGPTPRLCFQYASTTHAEEFQSYQHQLTKDIRKMTLDKLKVMTWDANDLAMDVTYHKIILVSRMRDDNFVLPMVAPITSHVKSRLASRLRNEERSRQLDLYKSFASVPNSRRVAGVLYESMAQRILQENIELELVPLVKLDGPTAGDRLPQWHSSHQSLDNPTLEALRQKGLTDKHKVLFMPLSTIEYRNDLSTVEEGIFYVPESATEVGFDSFIIINGVLYIFQFTIASSHAINPCTSQFLGGLEGISDLPMDWHFVFVIPPGSRLTCPQRPDRNWRLFSAELSVDATTTTTIASTSATSTTRRRPASDKESTDSPSLKRVKRPAPNITTTTTTTTNTPIASMSGTSIVTTRPTGDKGLTVRRKSEGIKQLATTTTTNTDIAGTSAATQKPASDEEWTDSPKRGKQPAPADKPKKGPKKKSGRR